MTSPQHTGFGSERIIVWFCRGVLAVVMASLVIATLRYEFSVLVTSNLANAYPPTIYLFMPSPGTSPVEGAPGAAGGDYSQVYTSALALRHGESAYFPTTPAFADRFGRPAGYPPLMNWLNVPLTYLPYYVALLLHVSASMLLQFGVSALILSSMGLSRHIFRLLVAQASLYLLTPVGFTHLERGQFDLIVSAASAAYVALVFIPRGAGATALVTGFLGTLKWTTAPFVGCFGAFAFALSSGRRRWCFPLALAVMLLGTALFWREVAEYLYTIRVFEIDAAPRGLTFLHYLPRPLAKLLPVLVTLLVGGVALFRARGAEQRQTLLFAASAPLSILLMAITVCYGTTSYEYHTVGLLGGLPGLFVWLDREPCVSPRVKALTTLVCFVLICFAFRTFQQGPPFDSKAMTRFYAVMCSLLLVISTLVVARVPLAPRKA